MFILTHLFRGCPEFFYRASESWSVTLSEGKRLNKLENRLLRRIFQHKEKGSKGMMVKFT
jgi:hypothetical protein